MVASNIADAETLRVDQGEAANASLCELDGDLNASRTQADNYNAGVNKSVRLEECCAALSESWRNRYDFHW